MTNRGLGRQMQPMEQHRDDYNHGDQRGNVQPRRLPAKPHKRRGTGKTNHSPENDLGQGVHAEDQPGNPDHDRRQQRRRQYAVTTPGEHGRKASTNHRSGGDMAAGAVHVHRPEQRRARQEHKFKYERREERSTNDNQPSQRTSPPALGSQCNGYGKHHG